MSRWLRLPRAIRVARPWCAIHPRGFPSRCLSTRSSIEHVRVPCASSGDITVRSVSLCTSLGVFSDLALNTTAFTTSQSTTPPPPWSLSYRPSLKPALTPAPRCRHASKTTRPPSSTTGGRPTREMNGPRLPSTGPPHSTMSTLATPG